ncbi:Predicted nucleotide-binding protein containing TIR-like domain-containing protein [Pseudomonas sp. URIL14HWK12:I8]|uniref:TIR domain-containing protein n=1 Tax=unclassified Pseudomonas TaxID=196821 RepID=UPI00040288AC|nr:MULTISPECIES: TIR domain-containing protein [unclassified Pseudomonas]SNB63588.1 Predicted nucleotide-binding protein containing TIR-like domain-containing protein [Pseudomonas sp. URIL14HWK12:I8]
MDDDVSLELNNLLTDVDRYLKDSEVMDFSGVELLLDAHNSAAKSWSRSWIGYQSRVYYDQLSVPRPGHHFSSEWGLQEAFGHGTTGPWAEYDFDEVYRAIVRMAGDPDISEVEKFCHDGTDLFARVKQSLEIILIVQAEASGEVFYKTLSEELKSVRLLGEQDFIKHVLPKNHSSRDSLAMSQGIMTPPHILLWARCVALKSPIAACKNLLVILKKAYSYSRRQEKQKMDTAMVGTNVFIGHGRSQVWRDLKDFLKDRLGLPYDEFNRVPVAGITNIQRLTQMLDSASVAFVVMTAEDEQADGKLEARTNVIHEVGLFQGRLGFTRAIVLLEEGCEEFSNIQGLGQIRFPKGDISAKFEDIRQVLEREGLIKS